MGGRDELVGARGVSFRPPPKAAPVPTSAPPPGHLAPAPRPVTAYPVQVIPRPRCPRCGSRNVWAHKTEGDLRHYHCRAGCREDGAAAPLEERPRRRGAAVAADALRFKVRMV